MCRIGFPITSFHIQMISELPGNSFCSLLFYYPYYTKVITIKIPKYLAGCFFLFPNWGVSFYFGNLLQPACVRYQFYISEHLELLSYNTSYIVPIKQCHIYWFYCVLTLYAIYRKSHPAMPCALDRVTSPIYNFI